MSTSVLSSSTGSRLVAAAERRALDGAAWATVIGLAVMVTILVAHGSVLAFVLASVALLVAVGFAAWWWPLPTLAGSALAVFADPEITPRLVPEGVNLGPIGASEPLLLVTGLVVFAGAIRRGTVWRAFDDPVTWFTLLFVALAIVSAVVNQVPPLVAFVGIFMTVEAIAVYVAARMLPVTERGAAVAIAWVVGVVVAMAVFGILQLILDRSLMGFFVRAGQFGEGDRITSFIGSPNMVAAIIGIALPFAVYGVRHLPERRLRWLAVLVLVILAWALMLTFSRGAWLAVGLGGVIGVLLVDWKSLPVLVLAIAVGWLLTIVMPRGILGPEPATGGGATPTEAGGGVIGSAIDRINNLADQNDTRARFLRDGLRIIDDHRLLGVGPGRYGGGAALIIERSPIYDEYDAELFRYRTVHNFWLHLLGESGALGTAVFLAMVAALLIRFVREAWRSSGVRFVVMAGAATMLLIVSFHSVTEMIFEGNMPVVVVWLVLGLASLAAPIRPLWRRTADAPAANA